jgi:hypothetical protein
MYGEIKTGWRFSGDDYHLNVSIPANTSATVYVLAVKKGMVTESDKSTNRNPNVIYLRNEGKYVVYEVKSGDYQFLSKGSRNLLKNSILSNPIIHPGDTLAQVHDSVVVNITSDVAEAQIHYTIDGSEPDNGSRLFDHPFYISKPTIIRAKAVLSGYEPSFVKTNYIDFINPEINGLTYTYYEGAWMKIPDFTKLTPTKSGIVYKFGLEKIISTRDEFGLLFEGMMQIKKDGEYEFYIQSNDGSQLYLNNQLVIDHDGPHGADIEKTGKINLIKGIYPIKLNYFQAGGGMFLRVQYSTPGIEKQDVPAMVLFQK